MCLFCPWNIYPQMCMTRETLISFSWLTGGEWGAVSHSIRSCHLPKCGQATSWLSAARTFSLDCHLNHFSPAGGNRIQPTSPFENPSCKGTAPSRSVLFLFQTSISNEIHEAQEKRPVVKLALVPLWLDIIQKCCLRTIPLCFGKQNNYKTIKHKVSAYSEFIYIYTGA